GMVSGALFLAQSCPEPEPTGRPTPTARRGPDERNRTTTTSDRDQRERGDHVSDDRAGPEQRRGRTTGLARPGAPCRGGPGVLAAGGVGPPRPEPRRLRTLPPHRPAEVHRPAAARDPRGRGAGPAARRRLPDRGPATRHLRAAAGRLPAGPA